MSTKHTSNNPNVACSNDLHNDFSDILFVGQGAYGKVYKAARNEDGKIYGVKCYNFQNYQKATKKGVPITSKD